jgi:hypothetical protein
LRHLLVAADQRRPGVAARQADAGPPERLVRGATQIAVGPQRRMELAGVADARRTVGDVAGDDPAV